MAARFTAPGMIVLLALATAAGARADTYSLYLDGWTGGICDICGEDFACADQYGTTAGVFLDHVFFDDPLPMVAIIEQVTVHTYGLNCNGAAGWEFALNGEPIASGLDPVAATCTCDDCQGPTSYASAVYPADLPGYLHGLPNVFEIEATGTNFCLAYIELEFEYLPCLGTDGDGDGYTDCDGDCDDGDATVYPGAPELCDGIDNDCDAIANDAIDADGDGFTPCDGDCDDGEPQAFPGHSEVCDGIDNDCDGTPDQVIGDDADGDGFSICDGDCDDADPTV